MKHTLSFPLMISLNAVERLQPAFTRLEATDKLVCCFHCRCFCTWLVHIADNPPGLVHFHTKTQGLWPIITTYYSGKWIPHICFQWMARLTLVLAYSILLHKPLANRCLCWSEWTLKLRPAAALWEQVTFAEGKVLPDFVYNCQISAAGFVEQFGSKPTEFSNVLV